MEEDRPVLRKKCPNMQFFLVRIFLYSDIQSEYRKIRTRRNSVFGHFSRGAYNVIIHIGSNDITHKTVDQI